MSLSRFHSSLLLGVTALLAVSGVVARADTETVPSGHAVTLTVTADGTAPFTHQWFKNGVALTGATASTYVIEDFASSDAGVYSAKVANSAGSTTSDQATLVFAAAPAFTTQPSSRTVVAGSAVTFTAVASGSPAPTYQWRRNGVAISGATAGSYTIASVTSGNAGTYSVVATNSVGTATSANAVLTVTPAIAPAFTTQPGGRTVATGSTETFRAVASGSPAPTYQWRKNGVAINGARSSTYTISNITTANAGTYSVVATNSAGSATSANAVLTVTPPPSAPVFTTQPASRTVVAGSAATFTATASGTPTPTYQWRKNGTAISGATGSSYTMASVTTANAGTYTVVATNSAGLATSSNAVLTVTPAIAPSFTTNPSGRTVPPGGTETFTAVATGSPTPTYQWRKNGVAISGATASSYTIAGITTASAGTYSVVATNVAGSATSSNAVLTVTSSSPGQLVRSDFNGDGKSDILWQNILTGAHRIWLMAGTSLASTVALTGTTTDWDMAGTGDFNNDGKADILWQNLVTREVTVWLMSGTTPASTVSLGVSAPGMFLAGTGDFNADGKADIIWQNTTTREFSIVLMNGTVATTTTSLGALDPAWRVAGTDDFNADGKTDILWENSADATCRVSLMNGTAYGSWVGLGAVPVGWRMGGTGDFNGDGKADVLWQNTVTGECKVRLMNGTADGAEVALGLTPVEWMMAN